MIRLILAGRDNYTLIPIDDLDDGPRWRLMILDIFGPLDALVTANPYVANLMSGDYEVLHPIALVPEEARVRVDGTMVRRAMARGDDWRNLVPDEVADGERVGCWMIDIGWWIVNTNLETGTRCRTVAYASGFHI